jgi:hypothetical protein
LVAALISTSASAQMACTNRANVVDKLAERYAEKPVALGIANNGGVVEVLSEKTGASWTIIITMPNGTACMIAAGENWEAIPKIASFDPTA